MKSSQKDVDSVSGQNQKRKRGSKDHPARDENDGENTRKRVKISESHLTRSVKSASDNTVSHSVRFSAIYLPSASTAIPVPAKQKSCAIVERLLVRSRIDSHTMQISASETHRGQTVTS